MIRSDVFSLYFIGPLDRINLDVGEVDPVEVREHLVDLGCVLEDSAGRLGQVVQAGVATQRLSKRIG